jgi:SAM-dependent methyltransferase
MLQNTGERFLPWSERIQDTYEHLHRYALAAEMAVGKKVLDLASGEGYGSALLAQKATHVTGVEIDPAAVHHANSRYLLHNLEFKVGSITQVPISGTGLFDVITCFEALEHITDQDGLFKEVKRLLAPDGIFLVSTPNKYAYTDQTHSHNPYHVKELYFDEFKELIARYFPHAHFLGQKVLTASHLWDLDTQHASPSKDFYIKQGKEDFAFVDPSARMPLYFIALVSNNPIHIAGLPSRLVDLGDELYRQQERRIHDASQAQHALHTELTKLQIAHFALEEKRLELDQAFSIVQKQLIASHGEIKSLQRNLESSRAETKQLAVYRDALNTIYHSRPYKLYKMLRAVKRRLIG